MTDAYQVIHLHECIERKLPGYEDYKLEGWSRYDSYWVLWECDITGKPIREVFADRMEPEDAILVRDLRPLVEELNSLARMYRPMGGTL